MPATSIDTPSTLAVAGVVMLTEPPPLHPAPRPPMRHMAWLMALTLLAWMPGLLVGSFIRDDWFNFQRRPAHHLVDVLAGDWMQPRLHPGVFYRPVSQWSMQLDAMLFGIGPIAMAVDAAQTQRATSPPPVESPFAGRLLHWAMPFHLTNVLLHAINGCLVFALLGMIPGMARHRFIAAAAFIMWPVHMGAVNWPSARTDILASTWLLLSLVAGLRALAPCHSLQNTPNPRLLAVAVAAALLALGTKELAAALPLLFVIAATGVGVPRPWIIRGASLCCLLVLGYLGIRLWALGGGGGYPRYAPLQLTEFITNIDRLISALVMPWSENARGGLLVWAAALLVGLALPSPKPLYLGLAWMAVACLPMGGLIATVADGSRYLYLPTVGLAMCIAWTVGRLVDACAATQKQRVASGARIAEALCGAYLLVVLITFIGHHASWLVAWRTADKTLEHLIAARRALPDDAPALVPLNLPPRHRAAYIQDVWSLTQAITYLQGQPDPLLRHVPYVTDGHTPETRPEQLPRVLIFDAPAPAAAALPGESIADLFAPRSVRSRMYRLSPLGQRDLFDIGRASIEKGDVLVADVPDDPTQPPELVFTNLDPPEQRLVLHGLNLYRQPFLTPSADLPDDAWRVEPGRYLFAGIAGATIRLRPQDLAAAGAPMNPSSPLVVQVDLNVKASRLSRIVMKLSEGTEPDNAATSALATRTLPGTVVHAFERAGPKGVPVPAASFAMHRVGMIELSFPAPGGWHRLEPSPVRIWSTHEEAEFSDASLID